MAGYIWQCSHCKRRATFPEMQAQRGIVTFIWRTLLPSNWDHNLLLRDCLMCRRREMRITFEFPRQQNPELLQIKQIVGIPPNGGDYLPMMWESSPFNHLDQSWFSFNYVRLVDGKMNSWGLNKAAVFDRDEFRHIVQIYKQSTGRTFQ